MIKRLAIGITGAALLAAVGCGAAGPKVGSQAWVDAASGSEWAQRAGFEVYITGIPTMRECRIAVEEHPALTRAQINRNLGWCEQAYK